MNKKKHLWKGLIYLAIVVALLAGTVNVFAHLGVPTSGNPKMPVHNENPYVYNGFVAPYTGYFTVYVSSHFKERITVSLTRVGGGSGGGSYTSDFSDTDPTFRRIDTPVLMRAGEVYNLSFEEKEWLASQNNYFQGEGWLPPRVVSLSSSQVLCGIGDWPWNALFGQDRHPSVNDYSFYQAVRTDLVNNGSIIDWSNVDTFIVKSPSIAGFGDNSLGMQCWGDNPTYDGLWNKNGVNYSDDVDFEDFAVMYAFRPDNVTNPVSVNVQINGSSSPYSAPELANYTVSWTSSGASTCSGAGSLAGYTGTSGSINVSGAINGTYTYGMNCSSSAGAVAYDDDVATISYVPYPTADVLINGSNATYYGTVGINSSYTVSWGSTNATNCIGSLSLVGANGTAGAVAKSSTAGTYTYTITCSNSKGSASDTIYAYIYNPPTVDVKINTQDTTQYFTYPGNYNATWTSTNALSCTGSNYFLGQSGTQNGTTKTIVQNGMVVGTYLYTMTCYNDAGASASDSITAYVVSAPTVDVKVNGFDTPQTFITPASYNATWTSTNATSCVGYYNFGGQSGTQNGTTKTVPQNNMTEGTYWYDMYCYNAAGTYAYDTVRVDVNPPKPTVDVKIDGFDVAQYRTAPATYNATWSSTGAAYCWGSGTFTGQSGTQNGTTKTVAQSNIAVGTYTYTMTCQNSIYDTATDTVTVTVVAAPTVDVKINGSDTNLTLPQPASYNVTWTSTNATSCTGASALSGESGTQNGTTKTISKSNISVGTYVYQMTCYNAANTSAVDSVTMSVIFAPPTVDLKVNGSDGPVSHPAQPGFYTLTWTTTNSPTSCTASTSPSYADWSGSVSVPNGSKDLNSVPWGTYIHSITCTNASGSASDSVTVTVGQPLSGSIFSHYTGLVLNGPNLPAPYGPLACQRLYGNIQGGVPPYNINVYVYSATRGDSSNGILYKTLSSNGTWETSPTGNPVSCTDKLFGTDFLGQWNAYIIITDRDGRTYNTKTSGTGQGYLPAWVVGKSDIHDTP